VANRGYPWMGGGVRLEYRKHCLWLYWLLYLESVKLLLFWGPL